MVESEKVIRYDTVVRRLAEYGVHDYECALPLCVSTKNLPISLSYLDTPWIDSCLAYTWLHLDIFIFYSTILSTLLLLQSASRKSRIEG